LIDLSVAEDKIISFVNYLKGVKSLSSVPILVNKRNLTSSQLQVYKAKRFVDEIVDFKVETSSIKSIVLFLNKVKKGLWERDGQIKPEYKPSNVYKHSTYFKRLFDLITSILLLIVMLPVFIIIAIALKIETRGPVFYNSYRAGKGYEIFKFYKFRTMRVGAERMLNSISHLNKYNNFGHAPVFFKIDSDPRVTRVGQFLRNTGLDELPQLFNVLIGDMSIVGNRPLPLYEASSLTNNEWAERFSVAAGITGLWQVTSRKSKKFNCFERINVDIAYAKKNDIISDCVILFKTPFVLYYDFINNYHIEHDLLPRIDILQNDLSKA
jgi:lipopolysaccharide/colanic/teichoic acid biosynthesis glycosyltransferase